MTTSLTLPTGPFEHIALDYARLRAEGIRQLGRLAGQQWTDYNAHDPGVTILEQLCYAITDLAYRTSYPVADLLAGSDLAVALPGPADILTCDPVTAVDLRKLVLDIGGIGNAWVEDPAEPELAFYYHQGSGELRLQSDPTDTAARPVRLTGLHRVLLQTGDRLSSDRALTEVATRLHARRGLGEDFDLALLTTHEVWIGAKIEVGPIEDPVDVLADVMDRIEAYLAPRVDFTGWDDAREAGWRADQLFEGPALARGFVLGDLPGLRRTVRASDLIHTLTDVPAVRAVRSLAMASSASATREQWSLTIPPGQVATLASGSELTLLRAGLQVRVDPAAVQARRDERRLAAHARARAELRDLRPPPGRHRDLARYQSIQRQLPAVYGVGPLGLPASASAARRAQARQLEAYLLLFDQLLADAFAQLAHAKVLLSPETASDVRTYFAQPVVDPELRLDGLVRQPPEAHRAWLESHVDPGDSLARRKRFLAHLLARYAEQLGDHSHIGERAGDDLALIADREAFLQQYPALSRARGSGDDLLGDTDRPSGFAHRLRLKLGLKGRPRFHVVEHVLLRPVPEDIRQRSEEGDPQVPLLAGVGERDPWSLQVSFVFEDRPGGAPGDAFEQMVAQTILAEAPAHLRPHLHWFGAAGEDHWSAFDAAWLAFRTAHRDYRRAKLAAATVPDDVHIRLRDARDRVIDLLGFARTYPLRDLPIPRHLIVAPGQPTAIPIELSQRGVLYSLRDRRTGEPVKIDGKPVEREGTGATIELPTPAIEKDETFRILAVKLDGQGADETRREAWLHAVVRVEEGVDPALVAQVRGLPLLDRTIDAARPTDARLADFGAEVEVEVLASQEGVDYELVDHADNTRVLSQQTVVGTGSTIVLRSKPVAEDVDLRVRASRYVGDPQHPELRTGLLTLVLPLRVRADRSPSVALDPPIVAHGAGTIVRLAGTQKSAEYRVYRRPLRDREVLFTEPPPGPTIDVKDGDRTIRIVRPAATAVWSQLEPLGDAKPGTGGALEFALPNLTQDSLLFVQAVKRHRKLPGSEERILSDVQLERITALLVRPDHQRPLRLHTELAGDATTGALLLTNGQPGVYYELRRDGTDTAIGLPAYFHQLDDDDARLNKGVEQLRIEVDAALARDPADAPADRSATPPLPPLVDIAPLPLGAVLRARARKAITGLVADLTGTATIAAAPAITREPDTVEPGEGAKIVIAASEAGERYRLLRGDQLVAEADGDGGRLELATGPLNATTEFQLELVRTEPGALPVERRLRLTIAVQP